MIKLNPQSNPLPLEKTDPAVDDKLARKLKLKRATQAFESIFIAQMLKNMHSASLSPKSEEGFGKDVMMEMADEGVAKQLGKTGMFGVGKLLYKNLLNRLDLEDSDKANGAEKLKLPQYLPIVIQAAPDSSSMAPAAADWKNEYRDIIASAAKENRLAPQLVEAVIAAESNGDPHAVSRKGALGLMQLMPDTARAVGVSDPLDPTQNINGGARYLRRMLDRFGDLRKALAAYNAGPKVVEKHDGVPPFDETQTYVNRIISDISNDN